MDIPDSISDLLSETKIVAHPDDFTIVSIDRKEEDAARRLLKGLTAFSSITFDAAEVSLVLKMEEWDRLKGRFRDFREEGPYRLITFDIVLDLSVVGFLAAVSSFLADEGISIYALSTFLRDHILVKRQDAERAVSAIQLKIDECKRRKRQVFR